MDNLKLIEILHPKMDILFVALNPPEISNRNGHYFSRNSSFWNLLFDADLITKRVKSPLTGDDEVFRQSNINYGSKVFGITDLVHDVIQTNSNKVIVDKERVSRIISLLESYSVKNLCLLHSKVGKAFGQISTIDRSRRYGLIGKIGNTNVYEMPFHNASISYKNREYKKLLSGL